MNNATYVRSFLFKSLHEISKIDVIYMKRLRIYDVPAEKWTTTTTTITTTTCYTCYYTATDDRYKLTPGRNVMCRGVQ